MGKLVDKTGKVFGDWKVIKFDNTKGKYKYYWICECMNCGNIKSINSGSLLNGKSLHCDKCNVKYGVPKNIKGYSEDLTGKVFGNLTVLKFVYKKHSHSHWLCRCRCGDESIYSISYLKQSKYKMCNHCRTILRSSLEENKINIINNSKRELSTYRKKYNTYEFKENYVLINKFIKIDIDDFEKINKLNRYWYKNRSGYVLATYEGIDIFLHRLILNLPIRYDKTTQLIGDHINGDRTDNRKSNLRIIKKELNSINCKRYSNNTSGVKGVCWNKRLNKWSAYLHKNGKRIYLGVHTNIEDAIKTRKKAEKKYFGDMNREGTDDIRKLS